MQSAKQIEDDLILKRQYKEKAMVQSIHAKELSMIEKQYKEKVSHIVSTNPHIKGNLFDYGVKFLEL